MSMFIEYYEVETPNGYLYYYMPIDINAKNKQNMDRRSHRIWKFNTRTKRFNEIKNIRENKPQLTRSDFLRIQLMASPVPWDEIYLRMEEIKKIQKPHE